MQPATSNAAQAVWLTCHYMVAFSLLIVDCQKFEIRVRVSIKISWQSALLAFCSNNAVHEVKSTCILTHLLHVYQWLQELAVHCYRSSCCDMSILSVSEEVAATNNALLSCWWISPQMTFSDKFASNGIPCTMLYISNAKHKAWLQVPVQVIIRSLLTSTNSSTLIMRLYRSIACLG